MSATVVVTSGQVGALDDPVAVPDKSIGLLGSWPLMRRIPQTIDSDELTVKV